MQQKIPVPVLIPRLNANEDQVLVVRVHVAPGDLVAEGDLLIEMETTKATSELLAPAAGRVIDLKVEEGAFVEVGNTVCRLADSGESSAASSSVCTLVPPGEGRLTSKARRRAIELGVDVTELTRRSGRITVEDIEAYASAIASTRPRSPRVGGESSAVIIGGGGHAAVVADLLFGQGYRIVGCVDDDPKLLRQRVLREIEVIGSREILAKVIEDGVTYAFIGVGGATSNRARGAVFNDALELGFRLPPLIHSRAHVGAATVLGPASIVLPGAVIGPRCRIGSNVIVNQGAQICHDTVVEDDCHITPSALIAGQCRIGRSTTVGMGASVLFGTSIGSGCLIHNNASVNSDVPDNTEVRRDGRRLRMASP